MVFGFYGSPRHPQPTSPGLVIDSLLKQIQATLLGPDMCNPDVRLNRTDWKVPVPSYKYNSFIHNPDFALSGHKFRVHNSPDLAELPVQGITANTNQSTLFGPHGRKHYNSACPLNQNPFRPLWSHFRSNMINKPDLRSV